MKGKFILVYILIFLVGISLYSNGLRQDLADSYKKVLADEKELVAIYKDMKDKDFSDGYFVDKEFQTIKMNIKFYINLMDLYSKIDPQCETSKKSAKDYLLKTFQNEAKIKKPLVDFLLKHQKTFNKTELKTYLNKCIEYNKQLAVLLKGCTNRNSFLNRICIN